MVLMGLLALLPAHVYACSTPVFRYALERWPADFYDGVLVHKGEIPEDHPAGKLFEGETAEFLNLLHSRLGPRSSWHRWCRWPGLACWP